MLAHIRLRLPLVAATLILALLTGYSPAVAQTSIESKNGQPVVAGQRVFSAGHSFHVFVPRILNDMAEAADIRDHVFVEPVGHRWITSDPALERAGGEEQGPESTANRQGGRVDSFADSPSG